MHCESKHTKKRARKFQNFSFLFNSLYLVFGKVINQGFHKVGYLYFLNNLFNNNSMNSSYSDISPMS